jgi:ribosome-binding protein aMBF1 (putative translation factor)
MQANNNPDVHSFDEILDAKYGAPGTPEREQFRREAQAYCVGVLIHDARKEEGITQQELAERVGIKKSYVSRIENGRIEPSAGLFLNILNALGLSIARPAI